MNTDKIQIESSWKEILKEEFEQEYFANIKASLVAAKKSGKRIYPPGKLIFNAFNLTPFDEVKVVIIGQDPYHGPGEAMGLCFSVPDGVKIPPSLRNIFKEQVEDIGIQIPKSGDLSVWAKQGVLLLNASLTVEHKSPNSHKKIGWHQFSNAVISKLSEQKTGLVFLLWGRFAQGKKEYIDEIKHYVLESAHPSPLAGKRFFGNHHFSRTNELLRKQGLKPINWQL